MYRVLIVDDEIEIREGLFAKFPWAEFGVDSVETADDGDTALGKAMLSNPDLILTDIKMNRMSGLELIRQVREQMGYECKAIVISGYDDFGLVRQAIQLGAIDYILKPINTSELSKIIMKAFEQVQHDRIDEQYKRLLENQVHLALPKLQEEMIREIVENPYNPYRENRMRHRIMNFQLDWILQDSLLLMIIEVDNMKVLEQVPAYRKEKELVLFGIGNVVKQTWEEEYSGPFALYLDEKGRWVIVSSCKADQIDTCKETARHCIERINKYVKVNVTIGLSSTVSNVRLLSRQHREAADILEQKIMYGGNRLLVDNELSVDSEYSDMSLSEIDEVFDLIKYGTEAEIFEVLKGFNEMVRTWSLDHIRAIQQRLFEWLLELYKRTAAVGYRDPEWERNPITVWDRLEQFDTLESMHAFTEEFVLRLSRDLRRQEGLQSQIITEAEKYIHEHYKDYLTLQGVASEVHVTPVWLSKLFKKEKQQTFLEYLTAIRIDKAKEMLGDVRYKIYQVSQEVGYRDPVHFSKLFRKHVGRTPKDYRKIRGIRDE